MGEYHRDIPPEARGEHTETQKDPEHNFPVPEELRQVTEEEVLEIAHDSWNKIMKRIRKERESIKVGTDLVSFELPVLGEPGRVNSLISLSTKGCMDAHRGECTFCDYGDSTHTKVEIEESLPHQVDAAFAMIEKENEGFDHGFINLTAIGSMFDPKEMPPEIRRMVYDRIADFVNQRQFPQGATWTTESRLKYVDEEILSEMKAHFAAKGIEMGKDLKIEVGYGIESTQPLVVEGAMGKKVPRPHEESIALMKKYGVEGTAHTLFKPPFLTEKESIEDTVKTVQYAFDKQLCDVMIVMSMNVRDATLVGELHEQGMYQLPSIWSVAEIMKQLGPEMCAQSHFFGFSVATEAANTITPKDAEESELMKKILAFAGTTEQWKDIVTFLDQASGERKKEWEQLMETTPKDTLPARIAAGIDIVGKKYLKKGFSKLQQEAQDRKDLPIIS